MARFLATKKKKNQTAHTRTRQKQKLVIVKIVTHSLKFNLSLSPCLTLTLTQSQLSTLSFYFPFTALTHQPPSVHHQSIIPFGFHSALCVASLPPAVEPPPSHPVFLPHLSVATRNPSAPSQRRTSPHCQFVVDCELSAQVLATPPSNPSPVVVGF